MIPRSFPPAPGWSPDGHRIKAALDYGRGPEKTWVYGALRPRGDHELTMTASCRNSGAYQRFLQVLEKGNPDGEIVVVTDNLSSHRSVSTRAWLEEHPRIRQVFIPVGACCATHVHSCFDENPAEATETRNQDLSRAADYKTSYLMALFDPGSGTLCVKAAARR